MSPCGTLRTNGWYPCTTLGIVCTNRWYSSYQLLVLPVPPDGIAGTACRNFISLYAIMNIILLPAGIIAGAVIGYLTAGRKAAALKTQVEAAGEREALLNRTAEERIARERSIAEERLQEAARQASERLDAQERLFAERLAEQAHSFNERLAQQQRQWEQRLSEQKEEAEALHKRMNTEFENLSNRIFQSKTEDFTRLNAEHLGNLLRPLDEKIKDFKER